jgi:DNA-binding transcriptional LysR family regulator
MVHKDNPLSQKTAADIQDLAKYPLYIESSEFNIHHDMMQRCAAAGIEPKIAFESSGFSLCQKMVSKNKGISVIVDFISDDMQNSDLVLLPFTDGPYYWETYMLTRRGEKPNPDIQLFRNFIMEWMHKIKNHEIQR